MGSSQIQGALWGAAELWSQTLEPATLPLLEDPPVGGSTRYTSQKSRLVEPRFRRGEASDLAYSLRSFERVFDDAGGVEGSRLLDLAISSPPLEPSPPMGV